MAWLIRRSFSERITKLLKRMGFPTRYSKDGAVVISISLERAYGIEIDEHGKFTRLTGHPNISFHPNRCPHQLLAQLLLRNGDANAGGWRLIAADERVYVAYSYFIPLKLLSVSNLKLGLETVLTEVNRFSLEYRYFKRT